jgi:hypothetical protein
MMSERPERVDGKTFDEWVAELSEVFSERQARQMTALKFGWQGDAVVMNADGTVRPRRKRSGWLEDVGEDQG